jgi:hypothetical protein
MSTKFFTNQDTNTLLNKFKGIFEHNKDIEFFDALVGYFRASGYFRIREHLNNVPKINLKSCFSSEEEYNNRNH